MLEGGGVVVRIQTNKIELEQCLLSEVLSVVWGKGGTV